MDALNNPFSPGAGTPPPELAGRSDILQQALMTLGRVKRGRSEKSMLLVGLRGTGKTVLLYEISKLAEKENYHVIMIEANEKKTLAEILLPEIRRVLFELDDGRKVKYALRVIKSFFQALKLNIKINDID